MKEELRQHEKRLVIHDLPAGAMPAVKDENIIEICDDGSIKSCIGCSKRRGNASSRINTMKWAGCWQAAGKFY